MYKGGRIIVSLFIFVAFLSIPFFYNMGKANAGPVINLPANTQCVESASYMLDNHMQLLNQWRNAYVQDGQTVYVNSQGKSFVINLDTCLQCHEKTGTTANTLGVSDPAKDPNQFCVTCHTYASVEPTCWSCHSLPGGAK